MANPSSVLSKDQLYLKWPKKLRHRKTCSFCYACFLQYCTHFLVLIAHIYTYHCQFLEHAWSCLSPTMVFWRLWWGQKAENQMSKAVFLLSSPFPERENWPSQHFLISYPGVWVRVLVIEQKTIGPHSSEGGNGDLQNPKLYCFGGADIERDAAIQNSKIC